MTKARILLVACWRTRRGIFIVSAIILYLSSLWLSGIIFFTERGVFRDDRGVYLGGYYGNCIITNHTTSAAVLSYKGGDILPIGWLGLFLGNIAWYANCFFFIALILACIRPVPSILTVLFALIGFMIGLHAWSFYHMPADEGGGSCYLVDHLGIGYYVWEMSFIFLAFSRISVKQTGRWFR
jgi:hypothetical protein